MAANWRPGRRWRATLSKSFTSLASGLLPASYSLKSSSISPAMGSKGRRKGEGGGEGGDNWTRSEWGEGVNVLRLDGALTRAAHVRWFGRCIASIRHPSPWLSRCHDSSGRGRSARVKLLGSGRAAQPTRTEVVAEPLGGGRLFE